MATFAFKAVDLQGVPTRGELDAESKQAVGTPWRSTALKAKVAMSYLVPTPPLGAVIVGCI